MRKFIVLLIAVFVTSAASSYSQFWIGPGLFYSTEIEQIGITGAAEYDINDKMGVAAAYTYFLEKDMLSWSMIDLEFQYIVAELSGLGNLYALAGLNILSVSWDIPESAYFTGSDINTSETGITIGAGMNIPLSNSVDIAPELKLSFQGSTIIRIGAKALFRI